MAKLGDVCFLYTGTGFPNQYQGMMNGEYPFYKVGDISRCVLQGKVVLDKAENYVDSEVVNKIRGTIIPPNSIVFAKIGEAVKLNRRAITSRACLVDNNAMGICPKTTNLDSMYLYYYMSNLKLEKLAEATTVPSVKKSRIESLEIALRTLDEQKRIGKQLATVDNLISNRKRQLEKLDELVKARFVELFGDLKTNPRGWPVVPFPEFAEIDGNMTTDYERFADYPHIGIDSIEKGTGELKGYRTVREDGVISGKYIFTPQHIIYSKIRPNLNKVALPNFDGLCSADAYPILPNHENCNRVFLAVAMRSEYYLEYILQFSSRTNLPKVNRKEIAGFRMPLPPLELQKQFATFVEQTDKSKVEIKSSLEQLETLKKALMQKYFG